MQPNVSDHYEIKETISRGSHSVNVRAYDKQKRREVVLKIFSAERISPDEIERFRNLFIKEAQTLSELNHPNIVKVLEFVNDADTLFYVMPYHPGGSLRQRMKQLIPYREGATILSPISEALAYCHKKGIVHCDIKPESIVFSEKGEPILLNFFIAVNINETDNDPEHISGTPLYMAPEQIAGEVTKQSDIYTLGLVFYEMITGNSPFKTYKDSKILMMKLTDEISLKDDLFPTTIPEVVKTTIQKATRNNLTDRYQNMEEFKEALIEISKAKITPRIRAQSSTQNSRETDVDKDNNLKNPSGGLMGFFKTSHSMLSFAKTVADIVDDLLLPKAGAIEKIAAAQIKILSKYYALALEQADRSFKTAMFWASVGLVAFIGALVFVLTNQSRDIAVISTIAGALVEVISGINFYLYNRASIQLGEFRGQLQETQKILLANSIYEKMSGERKLQTRSLIALKAAGINIDFDDSFFEKKAALNQIAQIIGIESGSLASENIQIHNQSKHPLSMAGWTLSDTAKHKYQFPEVILEPNKSIKVWTKRGQNDSSNLYWGRKSPIWNNSGDCVYLRDNIGKLINQYSYGQQN